MNEFILLLLEKVCEAIYFALFIIYGKNLKEKRLLFIGIMIFEYLLFKCAIKYNVWFQILYTFMSFVNLKVLYKDKAQITDIFLFMTASLFLIFIGIISYGIVYITFRKYIIALILNRFLLFLILIIFKYKIYEIYEKFYKSWNRHNEPNKIKSLTLRNISIVIFNLMFCFINIGIGMLYIVGKR